MRIGRATSSCASSDPLSQRLPSHPVRRSPVFHARHEAAGLTPLPEHVRRCSPQCSGPALPSPPHPEPVTRQVPPPLPAHSPNTKLSGLNIWPKGPERTESMVPGSRSTRTARGTYLPPARQGEAVRAAAGAARGGGGRRAGPYLWPRCSRR